MLSPRSYLEIVREHFKYIKERKFQEMVNETYTDEPEFHHNFPYFEGEPPYIHKGRPAIVEAMKTIFHPDNHGTIEDEELLGYMKIGNLLGFVIRITTRNRGNWVHMHYWEMEDNKIATIGERVFEEESAPWMIPQFIFAKAKEHPEIVRLLLT